MFLIYITTILLSYISTDISIPKVINFGHKFKLTDKPNKRKIHNTEKVSLGGVAIIFGFFISALLNYIIYFSESISVDNSLNFLVVFFISFLYFLIGALDDIYDLSPIPRLTIQFVLAYFIWLSGIGINNLDLSIFFDDQKIIYLHPIISLLITQFWIVGIINAINWLDGLDGLAAGISLISFVGYLVTAIHFQQLFICLILTGLIGTILAFLKYNKHPSRIMMGDGGAYFYGFYLAILGILTPINGSQNFQFFIPLIILFIPIADMAFVILSRIFQNKSPFYPDRRHLHHRLINRGFNSQKTVLIICFASLSLFCLVLILLGFLPKN